MKNNKIHIITETAILVALAIVLEIVSKFIIILKMPQGGSFSLAMLPIIVIAIRRGYRYGIMGGVVFGIVNFMLDGFWWHIGSIFFDYIFAFGLIGLVGLIQNKNRSLVQLVIIFLLAGTIRWLMHSLSGVLFFASYAEELGYVTTRALMYYSFIIYNLPYVAASTAGSLIVGILAKDQIIYRELES